MVLSLQLVKKDGKLIHKTTAVSQQYKDFMANLEEGQVVDVFFDANKKGGTYAQLSKIHVCIRELAKETGYSFDEMKERVKEHAGLQWHNNEGVFTKSFAEASTEELGLVIESINELGEMVGINFHQVFPLNQKEEPLDQDPVQSPGIQPNQEFG